MKQLIPLLFFISWAHLQAQQAPCNKTITGKIIDIYTQEPLPFATVTILDTSTGVIAQEDGSFKIENVCEGEIHLEVRFVGYKTIVHHHDFHHPSPTIYLAQDHLELNSVVVEESRDLNTLKSLSVASKEVDLLAALGSSAGNLLAGTSGVSTLKTGQNVVKPIVHGLHSNRVLIINNGVRHSYQAWGQEHAPEIDPSEVDRLSVVKGAATVRYGSEALGGVILFNADQLAFDSQLSADIGSNFQTNGRAVAGKVKVQQGFHRFAWSAGAYKTVQGNLHAPDYNLTNTGKREAGLNFSAKLHRPTYDLDLYVSRFDQNLGILRGSVASNLEALVEAINRTVPENTKPFSYDINNPRQETRHSLYKLKGSLFLGEHEVDVQYAFQRNLRKEFDIRRGSNNERPAINLELNTHSVDIDWKYPSLGSLEGKAGAQFFYQDNNNIAGTNTVPFIPNYNVLNSGIYTIQTLDKGSSQYELGFRYDYQYINSRVVDSEDEITRSELNYQNASFSFGWSRKLGKSLSIRTNLGSAWRPPKVGELFSFGKHGFVFEYGLWRHQLFPEQDSISTAAVLNDQTKPVKSEQGLKWITTLELAKSNFRVEFVPYINFIQNFFFTRPYGITQTVRGPFPYFIHGQTDALFAGLDLSGSLVHNQRLSSDFKLAYVYAQDIVDGQPFLEIPPLNMQYSITKELQKLKITFSAEWTARQTHTPTVISPESFLSEAVSINRNSTFDYIAPPRGFFLLHASASYRWEKLSVNVRLNNALNQSYRNYTDRLRYFADDVGRNLILALNYRLSK